MAHPDLQALQDSLLPFAESLLVKNGEFHPFGAVMYSGGDIQWIAAEVGEEFPPAQLLIDTMSELIKEQAASNEIRAAAICYDCLTIPPGETVKTDAIGFSLEDRLGESISVFLPYVKKADGEFQYRDLFAVQKAAQFFSNSSETGQ